MRYREAFTDFDLATMPAIPETWKDISFKHDSCPSFETSNGMIVCVDYADPTDRELGGPRFTVISVDDDCSMIDVELETDSWEEVLARVG